MSGAIDVRATGIPGCFLLTMPLFFDGRGRFVKILDPEMYAAVGLTTVFTEQYYTVSREGVLRGMHCQLPPYGHDKLVYCVTGRVLDAVVDLRAGSPTYGGVETFELTAGDSSVVYIPEGLAHGFCVIEAPATLVYNVTSAHAPLHDSGVRWDSVGIDWPVRDPVVSARDVGLVPLERFETPFVISGDVR